MRIASWSWGDRHHAGVVSADGREYVVTLRPEAVWEDGRPVTAAA